MIRFLNKYFWYEKYCKLVLKQLVVSSTDICEINSYINHFDAKYHHVEVPTFRKFDIKIKHALVLDPQNMPKDVVQINSLVTFEDVYRHRAMQIKIVLPKEENIFCLRLSLFSAVGLSLFGHRQGDTIICRTGKRRIRIKILRIE